MTDWRCTGTSARLWYLAYSVKSVVMGEFGQTGVIPVIQGGEAGVLAVRVGLPGAVRCNDVGNGGHPRGVSK